ncbi:xanthine dehydrogenase family protein molybdopterin-binding subunit [Robiginitalea sediminis]|uniref:xanthine dehydrogenase family protein molybdopterin-binding subunit n=1 Tax=Robiginitalea sediminis TaxID=1982593 RepID=UPI000B4BA295|nr:molybdopterin cofactor-binding domain-containing protein [Robiginitalea sediminis]
MPHPNTNTSTSRRQFLKTTGGTALFIGTSGLLPTLISCSDKDRITKTLAQHELTAWVRLAEDGSLTIFNPAAEMGQGSMTSLPLLFAEEMDADWNQVQVAFSPQVTEIYGSPGWAPGTKLMFTVGSRTTNSYYNVMRNAGAQARYVLMYSAAQHWQVPLDELETEPHRVLHRPSGKALSFGELASLLQMPETLPEFGPDQLKDPTEFRWVGKEIARTEIPAKVDGSARFACDIRLPEMIYGVLERGNLHGSRPTLRNESDILAMKGVLKIVPFEYAIGVVAETLEAALTAKNRLEISWSEAPATGFNSQEIFSSYANRARSGEAGETVHESGDVSAALASAVKVYSGEFRNDYVYHAQMEPLNAVARISEDGQKAEVWVGSQQGPDSKLGVPGLLGIPPENVDIHLQYLGGGFGRRSMNDFVTECVLLAKEMAPRPVKLLWTREDDVRYGAYRPLSLQHLKAGVDGKGRVTALYHCVVGDGGNLVASGSRNDHYDIPNQCAEWRETSHGVRLKHWRSVGHGPNKYAIECLLDEVAAGEGMDPVALRRNLMARSPRALATLNRAAEMAGWDTPAPEGRARGVAFVEHGSLGTGICEISVNRSSGDIRVHRFWCALDAGVAVHPDNIRAQMEGGLIMGMSSVLKERITIVDGHVQQSNYSDYPLLRMNEAPESIEVDILPSSDHPEGVGETATPMVACAIANAFFRLTGKRLRHLPFTPERVREALAS